MGLKDSTGNPLPDVPNLPVTKNLPKVIIAISIAMALITVIGVFAFGGPGFGETRQLIPLPWVQPAAQSLMILAAIALAVLFLGRGLTLGSAWAFRSGILFLAHGILSIFYLLSWPGLLGDRGVVAELPNTSSWFAMLVFSLVALQITAVRARLPERLQPRAFLTGYAAAIVLPIFVGLLSLRFEDRLPTMIVEMRFTPLTMAWSAMLIVTVALAAISAYRRYRAGEDDMLGYMTLFLLMFAFGYLHSVLGGKRYDLWWYVGRFNLVAGYLVVLFGFLQEGYVLFARERDRAEELARKRTLLNAINRVFRKTFACETVADVASICLEVAGELTGCKFGFIGEVNEAGRFDELALTNPGWDVCQMPDPEKTKLIRHMEIRSYWGSVLETGEARIVNDPSSTPDRTGLPEGHPPITSFLGVPLEQGGKTIGMIALANKEGGFTETDRQDVEALSVAFVEVLNRKRKERQITHLASFPEINPNPVIEVDAQGKVTYYNNAALEALKTEDGTGDIGLFLPADLPEILKTLGTEQAEPAPLSQEVNIGARIFERNIYLFKGLGVVRIYVNDITERKRAEEEIKEHARQLEAANKELNDFNHTVAHDLRPPLRIIGAFSQILLKGRDEEFDGDAKQKLQSIRDYGQRMSQLLDDLLTFSQLNLKSMSLSVLDMGELVKEVWKDQNTHNPGREMELRVSALPEAFGDRTLIGQVLANLLSNAVKFTCLKEPAVIEIGGKVEERETLYWVKDNGVGFNMDYSHKLFGMFQRLHGTDEFEGTGVGLAIVQRIIHRHGGRVWAEGKENEGATFYFTLARKEMD